MNGPIFLAAMTGSLMMHIISWATHTTWNGRISDWKLYAYTFRIPEDTHLERVNSKQVEIHSWWNPECEWGKRSRRWNNMAF